LTVARERLGELRAHFEMHLEAAVAAARHADALEIDGALTAGAATPALLEMIERAGPFGAGNPEPTFALPAHMVVYADPAGAVHVRARLRAGDGTTINAIAFRAFNRPLGEALFAARGRPLHVAGSFQLNSWQGQEHVELRILDAALAEPLAAR
jgi:single-stranded-DNA-specific exonuclease